MSTAPRIDRLERNIVINGGMDFWQRVVGNTTTVSTAGPGVIYTADRISAYLAGTTAKSCTVARSIDVPSIAQLGCYVPYSYKFTCLSALTTYATSDDVAPICYKVEGYDYQRIHGKTFTMSFWAKMSVAGTYSAYILGAVNTRSYLTTFSIASANVWQYVSITMQAESTGAYNFTNSTGIEIGFCAYENAIQQSATLNTWQAGILKSVPGTVNPMSVAGQTIQFTGFSIIEGSGGVAAGSFARAGGNISQELNLCLRYYEKTFALETAPATNAGTVGSIYAISASGPRAVADWKFQVRKRTPNFTYVLYSPTANATNQWNNNSSTPVLEGAYLSDTQFYAYASVATSSNSSGYLLNMTADAEL
jgi:hypothetical protein